MLTRQYQGGQTKPTKKPQWRKSIGNLGQGRDTRPLVRLIKTYTPKAFVTWRRSLHEYLIYLCLEAVQRQPAGLSKSSPLIFLQPGLVAAPDLMLWVLYKFIFSTNWTRYLLNSSLILEVDIPRVPWKYSLVFDLIIRLTVGQEQLEPRSSASIFLVILTGDTWS